MEALFWYLGRVKIRVFLLLSLGLGASPAYPTDPSIPNFEPVSPGIFRGARPAARDLEFLVQKLKVRTVIDLEGNVGGAVAREKKRLLRLGGDAETVEFVEAPFSPWTKMETREEAQVEEVLRILADPARRPVYIHCKHGEDRTGMLVGLHRVRNEGWTPEKAWAEMKRLHFHDGAFPRMREYFWRNAQALHKSRTRSQAEAASDKTLPHGQD